MRLVIFDDNCATLFLDEPVTPTLARMIKEAWGDREYPAAISTPLYVLGRRVTIDDRRTKEPRTVHAIELDRNP